MGNSEYDANKHLAKSLQVVDYQEINKDSLMNERKPLNLSSGYAVYKGLEAEGITGNPDHWSLLELV